VQQVAGRDFNRRRQAFQRRDFRVAFPSLDSADLGCVNAAALRDLFLRQLALRPRTPQVPPEVAAHAEHRRPWSSLMVRPATIGRVYTFLAVLQVIIAGLVIFLILLHSGKDAGLSGAFGIGGGGSSFGGGSMVERNLDRATVFFAILFVVNTVVLLKI
jgi:preprotein translocase subunit SecG